MNEIAYIIANWTREKRDEVYAVKKFLDNAGVSFEFTPANVEAYPTEPADVWVKDIDKKFQVVVADFPLYEALGKAEPDNMGIKMVDMPRETKADVWRKFMIEPLQKKSKYGKSAAGVILLIKAPFDPPWIEKDMELQRIIGSNQALKELGFDEIYLVCSDKNICLYP